MTTAALYLLAHLWWLAPIVAGAWLFTISLGRAAARPMPPMPLPAPDATDAEFEAWARQALCIANSAAFEADVRADIAALPETKETA